MQVMTGLSCFTDGNGFFFYIFLLCIYSEAYSPQNTFYSKKKIDFIKGLAVRSMLQTKKIEIYLTRLLDEFLILFYL